MKTVYRKVILNIVDRCFHMYASDYRKEAKESAIEMLEEIPDPTTQLQSDKAELLEALGISLRLNKAFGANSEWFEVQEIESIIQKHKQ